MSIGTSAAPVELDLPPMTAPQVEILAIDQQAERCWDVEGAPRSAKSWGIGFWIWKLAYTYPGIQIFYCRYKDDDLKTLRDVWNKVSAHFPEYLQAKWNAKEEAWDFPNGEWRGEVYSGSRVYLSSLRVAEAQTTDAVHGKYKGKTIAVVVVEEAQEVPRVNYRGLKERLSQSRTPFGQPFSYPLKIVLVHNAIDEDHWINEEFPLEGEACRKADHRHIRADLYSNSQNLGTAVMAGYELDYPRGHVLRRTTIEGRRGITLLGKPVYEGYYDRDIHPSDQVQVNPYYPLIEGWDFGHEKPAVVWWQYLAHVGAIQILGAVKGADVFLEHFAPKVLEIRTRWFPLVSDVNVQSWCDPAGATGNGGTLHTPVRTLHDLGVPARYTTKPNANDAEVRYAAIQVAAGFMLRAAADKSPAFQVHPRCIELSRVAGEMLESETSLLTTAFEAGYIWDDKALPDSRPNIRKPKKGTRYDDLMNAFEYGITGENISVPQTAEMLRAEQRLEIRARKEIARIEARRTQAGRDGETLPEAAARISKLNRAARDHDPMDRPRTHVGVGGRGGYR